MGGVTEGKGAMVVTLRWGRETVVERIGIRRSATGFVAFTEAGLLNYGGLHASGNGLCASSAQPQRSLTYALMNNILMLQGD